MFDKEGFLLDLNEWSTEIAEKIAADEGVALTDKHWEIIDLARAFQKQFDQSPEMRPLVKWVKQNLGDEKGNSIYLLSLFPNSPAKLVSKIAGLPKPPNCL